MTRFLFILLPLTFIFISCRKDKTIDPNNPPGTNQYIHISHTRTSTNPEVDNIAEKINYDQYDMRFLGGDMAQLSSEDDFTISRVDSIFDIGSPNTLWSLGNHDYTDLVRVEEFTNRPPYYAYYNDGITYIVLDTQDSLSNIIGDQKVFFDGVVDTISQSSHLVILHHKLIWMYGNDYLEPLAPDISNTNIDDCFFCINPNNFYTDIYPKLLTLKQKGIEVLCIGGDIGIRAKEFEYTTEDGIHFLASGIYYEKPGNKALLFRHDINNRTLTWEFRMLEEL